MNSRKIVIVALLAVAAFLMGAAVAEAWVVSYASDYNDVARALVVASDGTTYVLGNRYDSDVNKIIIQRNLPDGTQDWGIPYNNPNGNPDYVNAAALLSTGGIIGVGKSVHPTNGHNWRIINYNSDSSRAWAQYYNSPANKDDVAEDVAIDASNYIYVAGWSMNSDGTKDLMLQKWGAGSNQPVWSPEKRVSNLPAWIGVGVQKPVHVELDGAGNAYLAGTVYMSQFQDNRWYLVKYEPNGYSPWSTWFGGVTSGPEMELHEMVVAGGYAYLTGKQVDENGVRMLISKYDLSLGGGGWGRLADFPGRSLVGTNVAVDSSGNVFALGRFLDPVNGNISALIKYDASGNLAWQTTFTSSAAAAQSMAVDGSGNVIVSTQDSPYSHKYVTRWWNSSGQLVRQESYSPGTPQAIGLDGSNNIYVTGYGTPSYGPPWTSLDTDMATVRYTP